MKKIGKILLTSLLIISLAGCGKVAKLKNGEQVVAKTNKGSITADDIYEVLEEQYGTEALIDLVDHMILDNKYKDGVDEYVNEQLEQVKQYATQYNVSLEQYIQSAGYESVDEVKDYFKLIYKRNQAVNEYVEKTITDKEIKKYYEDEVKPDINCKHILISIDTTDDMTESEKEQADTKALNTAKDIIKKLNNGEDWDKLAKKYSSDESNKNNGGDLGYFNTGDMVSEFEEAAYNLKKGAYTTEPVKTTYGYHIIYKVDEKKKASLKSMKEEIIETLRDKKLSEDQTLSYKAIDEVRKENGFNIEDSSLSKAYKNYMNKYTTNTTNTTNTNNN